VAKRGVRQVCVLAVDDEETDLTIVSRALHAAGYEVLPAANYAEAIAHAEKHGTKIRLLIADIALPDGNGCALALALKAQIPALRVLFVSGHVGAEVCKYYGLDVYDVHFLRKPYTDEQLRERVLHILASAYAFPHMSAPKVRTSAG
jgi:DNA-binding response OmpR family regulator